MKEHQVKESCILSTISTSFLFSSERVYWCWCDRAPVSGVAVLRVDASDHGREGARLSSSSIVNVHQT
jgi:hypothetical protein